MASRLPDCLISRETKHGVPEMSVIALDPKNKATRPVKETNESRALRETPPGQWFPYAAPQPRERDNRDIAFSFRGISRKFGDKTVLDNIDLDVPAGQFIAVIGKSGCGKSTLLRLLTGLDKPTSGTLTVNKGTDNENRTRIMFQEPRLLPWAKIAKNVEVGLTGLAKGADAREKSLAILDEVGLADRAEEWPSVLVRRPAPARRPRPRTCRPSVHFGTRRTARRTRCADPHRDATSSREHLAAAGIHRRAGHP
jgi:ABC-type glutathione transport system ATPase component